MTSVTGELTKILVDRQNLQYEDEVVRNPYHLKSWLKYLEHKSTSKVTEIYILFERALKFLPRSYKLWHAYLSLRSTRLEFVSIASKRYETLVNTFERALVHMHKMPVIWLMYCNLMVVMRKGTSARKVFDRALQSLPITQHDKIWNCYISWAKNFGVEETAIRVFRRFLMFDSSRREEFVTYLESREQYAEAARQLAICVNDDHYISPTGVTKHQMWMQLCDICSAYPEEVSSSLKVDCIIRSGIARFSDEVGKLWTKLADYYICMGQFEKARDIYEEAIHAVITVKDFSLIFDSYAKFEESVVMAKMQTKEEEEENEVEGGGAGMKEDDSDIDMRLARLEYLMDSRPLLLNSVVLRQNPHNVHEWHKRVKLMDKDDTTRILMTYMEAIKSVDPKTAVGKLSGIWLALAKFYESYDDLVNSRSILTKATKVEFRNVDELASVWCYWSEMELRHQNYDEALAVMQQAVLEPISSKKRRAAHAAAIGKTAAKGSHDTEQEDMSTYSVVDRVYKSIKVWNLYLDLEENIGSIESCRAAYDRAMEIKIATPKMILNYVGFLEDNHLFEDGFRIFERAVTLFSYPHSFPIWIAYLDKFMLRYEGTKLERLRDLFEESVKNLPKEFVPELYVKYGKAEETYGLPRHALVIYDRLSKLVSDDRKLDAYRLYIRKMEHYYGVTKTRQIYERAISELSDDNARILCLEYASVESKLGEIDRARSIYQHGSQFADPRREHIHGFWKKWKAFEQNHGNEVTFREMLRIQRSIETAFSQVNYLAGDLLVSEPEEVVGGGVDALERQAEMRHAQQQESSKRKFVAASTNENENQSTKRQALTNPDDINIDDVQLEEVAHGGDSDDIVSIQTKPVPSSVFGSIDISSINAAKGSSSNKSDSKVALGALDRFSDSRK